MKCIPASQHSVIVISFPFILVALAPQEKKRILVLVCIFPVQLATQKILETSQRDALIAVESLFQIKLLHIPILLCTAG